MVAFTRNDLKRIDNYKYGEPIRELMTGVADALNQIRPGSVDDIYHGGFVVHNGRQLTGFRIEQQSHQLGESPFDSISTWGIKETGVQTLLPQSIRHSKAARFFKLNLNDVGARVVKDNESEKLPFRSDGVTSEDLSKFALGFISSAAKAAGVKPEALLAQIESNRAESNEGFTRPEGAGKPGSRAIHNSRA